MVRFVYPFSHSFLDYPEKASECITIYFTGCSHNCTGCHNKELQNPNTTKGTKCVTGVKEIIEHIEQASKKYRTKNVCLMGGDPLYKDNYPFVKELIESSGNKYNYCVYTGYELEDIPFLTNYKYIKAGKYEEGSSQPPEKTDSYFRLASKNQYIINSDYVVVTFGGTWYYD